SAWLIFSIASAVVSSVFDGIASVIVQLPPSWCSSTNVTSAPRWAAVAAAAYPAGPPPRITSLMREIVDSGDEHPRDFPRRRRPPRRLPLAPRGPDLPGQPRR